MDDLGPDLEYTEEPAQQRWDAEISPDAIKIPKSLYLMMCDVDCGTETPGMVRKVLSWRKEKPDEARLLWAAIQEGTGDLCFQLRQLSQQKRDYHEGAKKT